MEMQYDSLQNIGLGTLTKVFNEAFSDYFVPFTLSEEQLQDKMEADKINLRYSVGTFEKDKLVGFILHGIDTVNGQTILYNGGTGVIPSKRGHGLTQKMYAYLLPKIWALGVDAIQLEVIAQNAAAIHSYKKSGFVVERELACYRSEAAVSSDPKQQWELRELATYDWVLMQSFWDCSPSWQNAPHVLDALKPTLLSLGAFVDNALVGYVLYHPKNKRLHQIAIHKQYRQQGIGRSLLAAIQHNHGTTISIINIDTKAVGFHNFLQAVGFEKSVTQLAMQLER